MMIVKVITKLTHNYGDPRSICRHLTALIHRASDRPASGATVVAPIHSKRLKGIGAMNSDSRRNKNEFQHTCSCRKE